MSWILQIDTALETAAVSLCFNGKPVAEKINHAQKDHAAFLHPSIMLLLKDAGITPDNLKAVAVVEGPGSYTGLRVGLAAAKGLCFALKIPLITIGTLDIMAAAAITQLKNNNNYGTMLVCPMIDARRMEVYTALYSPDHKVEVAPDAVIINELFLKNELLNNRICFFGTGANKWKKICTNKNAIFLPIIYNGLDMIGLTYKKFTEKIFADPVYSVPVYLKDFHFQG